MCLYRKLEGICLLDQFSRGKIKKRFSIKVLSIWNYLWGEVHTENWGFSIRGGSNGTGTTNLQTKALSHLKILSPPKLCLQPNPAKRD